QIIQGPDRQMLSLALPGKHPRRIGPQLKEEVQCYETACGYPNVSWPRLALTNREQSGVEIQIGFPATNELIRTQSKIQKQNCSFSERILRGRQVQPLSVPVQNIFPVHFSRKQSNFWDSSEQLKFVSKIQQFAQRSKFAVDGAGRHFSFPTAA